MTVFGTYQGVSRIMHTTSDWKRPLHCYGQSHISDTRNDKPTARSHFEQGKNEQAASASIPSETTPSSRSVTARIGLTHNQGFTLRNPLTSEGKLISPVSVAVTM
jgi:hypothetical protein